MMIQNIEEYFKEIIKSHEEWNFVAVALTAWHANGIDCCTHFFERENIKPKGCVFIKDHKQTGRCITESSFSVKNENIEYVHLGVLDRSIKELLDGYIKALIKSVTIREFTDPLYVVTFDEVDFVWLKYAASRNVIFLLCDDGLGGYISFANSRFVQNSIEQGKFKACYKYAAMRGRDFLYKFIYAFYSRKGGIIDRRLLTTYKGTTRVNRGVVEEYRKLLTHKNGLIKESLFLDVDKHIVLATDSFEENHMNNKSEDMLMFDVVYQVLKELNLDTLLVIKPHPRENNLKRYEKYNCTVLDRDCGTIEAIVGQLGARPLAVISLYSSAMISLNLLFDIKTISLGRLLLRSTISRHIKKDVASYMRLFSDYVEFPNDAEELKMELRKI